MMCWSLCGSHRCSRVWPIVCDVLQGAAAHLLWAEQISATSGDVGALQAGSSEREV